MMKASVKLGNIWGIPIGLHTSWFLIFGLLVWSLATGYFPGEYPQLSPLSHVVVAAITSILFFGSVLAHELGHSLIALRNKIPVKGITLFIFGGVAQIAHEPRSPGAEFRIAIAGPLTSLALAGLFGGLWLLDNQIPFLAAPSMYLMRINFMLALFNMIPGFPLDGGRVLRALVWQITRNPQRATQIAAVSGQLVAFGFIGFGIYTVFSGQFLDGLWLGFIGWFLQNAAASASFQSNVQERLRGVTVAQAMSRECAEVPGLVTLNQLVQERVLGYGQHCFFVTDFAGQTRGMLTLQDITQVPQARWRYVTAEQAMTPFNRLVQNAPETDLLVALQTMEERNLAQVPVVQYNRPVGLLSRENVLRYLRVRTQLGV
jgi:Zn-dependent protease